MMARVSASVVLVASVLAVAAGAPSAFASHATEVQAHSVTLGPGGSVSVSGSIECTEGYFWSVGSTIRQKSGKTFNTVNPGAGGICSTTGTQLWTTNFFFGAGPFKSGNAVIETSGSVCDPSFTDCAFDSEEVKEIRIRR